MPKYKLSKHGAFVLDEGHRYLLFNEEKGGAQELQFLKKENISNAEADPNSTSNTLTTVADGTTNEEVLRVLIDRLNHLNEKFPCKENEQAINLVQCALFWLEERTRDRQKREVEGKHLP